MTKTFFLSTLRLATHVNVPLSPGPVRGIRESRLLMICVVRLMLPLVNSLLLIFIVLIRQFLPLADLLGNAPNSLKAWYRKKEPFESESIPT